MQETYTPTVDDFGIFVMEVKKNSLVIRLTDEGKQIKDKIDPQDFHEFMEGPIGNGWSWIPPENIGALTDNPFILTYGTIEVDEETGEEVSGDDPRSGWKTVEVPSPSEPVFYYGNYMLYDPLEVILEQDSVEFDKA